jgi:LacI family transcriptional regulator, galactose operon repressor
MVYPMDSRLLTHNLDCDTHNIHMEESPADVTIQDVAARAGVSAMTVSRVINQPARVAPVTRQRVEQAIRELGFVPNALARQLLRGRTHTLALLVSDIGNPFFTQIARGVEDVAQRNGYTVIFGNSDESVEKERQYLHALLGRRIDGLLIAPAGNGSRPMLDLLVQRGTPFVLLDRAIDGVPADVVIGDNIGGARKLTEHLIGLGHRRIALVNGDPAVPTARDRRRGYLETLRDHGIAPQPELIIDGVYRRDSGTYAARQLLALPDDRRPTAIFAANNFLAVGVIEALRAAQVRIPRDIAVACFDDIEIAAALDPFLTVMAQPARTFGTIGAQFLLERLEPSSLGVGPRATPAPRRVVLPPELIVRVSCGAQLDVARRSVELIEQDGH